MVTTCRMTPLIGRSAAVMSRSTAKRTIDRTAKAAGARQTARTGGFGSGGLRLGGRRLRRLLLRRLLLGGRRGRRLRLRAVLAVGGREALAAARLAPPALAVVLAELVERLALGVALQDLLDRRLGLGERLLLGGRDLRDLEDVVAELRLHRAGQLALLRLEDRLVQRLLLLALGDVGEQAALRLRGLVDRVLLRDALPRLTGLQRALGLLRAGLLLGEHDPEAAALGRRELRLVLVVVGLDLGVRDLARGLRDLLGQLLLQQLVALLVEH